MIAARAKKVSTVLAEIVGSPASGLLIPPKVKVLVAEVCLLLVDMAERVETLEKEIRCLKN